MASGIADDIASVLRQPATKVSCAMCRPAFGRGLETELPDGDDALLELLSYVALSATKAGVAVEEPLCRINYWHEGASVEVTMDLRVADFTLDKAVSPEP
jgi:hypothetical protein